MACILKIPNKNSIGVISFTTPEKKIIDSNPILRKKILALKKSWMIGLHHNWHDFNFRYDPLYDFSFAGDGDLIEKNGVNFSRVAMDACNFAPQAFYPSGQEKFWDVLYVARAVFFKKIPEFFEIIRKLFDVGYKYRILFVCPMPPYDKNQRKTVFYNIRSVYDAMFSEDEKNYFTLLTIDYRYPFPFDLETLAFFYRSSKIFVHTADDERRCRVASYAWACGMPVVGMSQVASLLPDNYRKPPYLYEPIDYDDFGFKIIQALNEYGKSEDLNKLSSEFCEIKTVKILDQKLKEIATSKGQLYSEGIIFEKNLSLRLGRHHSGISGPNSFCLTLEKLIEQLPCCVMELSTYLHDFDPEKKLEVMIEAKNNFKNEDNFYFKKLFKKLLFR